LRLEKESHIIDPTDRINTYIQCIFCIRCNKASIITISQHWLQ